MAKSRTNLTANNVKTINYKASETLSRFHKDESFVRGIKGPIGSGKSVGCCMEIFIKACNATPCADGIRRSKWAIVRNTQPQLETTTLDTWLSWFPESIFGKVNRKPPMVHFIKINDVELTVLFLAMDKPEDVRKLLSLEVTGVWFNEVREINKAIVDAATGRVGRYPSKKDCPANVKPENFPSWSGVIMDTNPPDDCHWFYRCAENDAWAVDENGERIPKEKIPKHKRWAFFHQPSGLDEKAENIENLPKDYYSRIIIGKDKEWINVYVHGNYGFIQDGKPVYKNEWNDTLHVTDSNEINKNGTVYIGLDFGLTPCAVFGQMNARGVWHIFHELVTDDMAIEPFAKLLNKEIQAICPDAQVFIYGDPAGEFRDTQGCTVFEILKKHGLMARKAQTNNYEIRRAAVCAPLCRMIDGKAGFLLYKGCEVLRRGFNGGYKYRKLNVSGGENKYGVEAEKNQFSHPHDALQYMLMGGGEFKELRGRSKNPTKTIIMDNSWSVF